MQFKLIKSQEEFNSLSEEWNSLLTCCSASHVPFLRHEYLTTWWQTRGGGEWPDGELNTIVGRDAHSEMTGIAPLFFTRNLEGQPALMLLGSIEISDYLDLIVPEDSAEPFTDALFDFLVSENMPEWQVLDCYNILEDAPTLPAIENAAGKRGWEYRQEHLQHCPYIELPGDWEQYLAGIDKKQRHEIRRKMRRAEAYPAPVRWYFVEDRQVLDEEIAAFLDLMAYDPDKAEFLTGVMRTQMRAAVHAAYDEGWLQLAFLEAGTRKVAGYLNFDYGGHIWVYNSGIDFKFRDLSPGWVLLGELLKWANENERRYFDFMRGDEAYKYRFGAVDRFVVRATVNRG